MARARVRVKSRSYPNRILKTSRDASQKRNAIRGLSARTQAPTVHDTHTHTHSRVRLSNCREIRLFESASLRSLRQRGGWSKSASFSTPRRERKDAPLSLPFNDEFSTTSLKKTKKHALSGGALLRQKSRERKDDTKKKKNGRDGLRSGRWRVF